MEIVRVNFSGSEPQVRFPNVCPHCLEPADTVWRFGYPLMKGRYRQTIWLNIPFRQACLDRRQGYERRKSWLAWPTAIAVVLVGAALIIVSGSKDWWPQVVLWGLFGWIVPVLIMNAIADRIIGGGVTDYKTLINPISYERIGQIGQEFFDFKVAQPEYARKLRELNQSAA